MTLLKVEICHGVICTLQRVQNVMKNEVISYYVKSVFVEMQSFCVWVRDEQSTGSHV